MLIEANGVRLFALEAGQGDPALLFIHGNGADHTAWHKQIAFFSNVTRVIALDLRGFGASGKDPDGSYTQEKFVGDVQAVLAALEVRSAILVGWSMGGSVASRLAVEHPERVAGVVLVDHNVEGAKEELGLKSSSHQMLRVLADDFEGQGFRSMVDSWFPETGEDIDVLKQWFWETGVRAGKEVVLGIRRVGVKEDRREWLRRLTVPVLITQGGASYLGGHLVGEYLARLIPGARLQVFEGHGHALFLTDTDAFNHALLDFFQKVRAGQAGPVGGGRL